MLTSPRNFLVSNVELNWARLDQPVSPFGTRKLRGDVNIVLSFLETFDLFYL